MRRFCIGDIHGRYDALLEVLKKCKFDYEKDLLIVLGDIVDGGTQVYEVVEELLKIKNLVYILGNHDDWFIQHFTKGFGRPIWLHQGGKHTIESYGGQVDLGEYRFISGKITKSPLIPVTHQEFFNNHKLYYEMDDMLFVHAGINPAIPKITSQSRHDLLWDRHIINFASRKEIPGYKKVFIGHSTTQMFNGETEPLKLNNLIMMDCGAGWNGCLAIMDIDTEEFWTSELQESIR